MKLNIKKGFTLIELLVVIAIIGILAALIIVSLSGAQKRARDTQRKNNARSIDTALAQYYVDNNSFYPGAATAVPVSGPNSVCASTSPGSLGETLITTGKYLSSVSTCNDPQSLIANYKTDAAAPNATKYVLVWPLENAQEKPKNPNPSSDVVNAGNGVYQPFNGGFTAGGVSIGGLAGNARYFVVYGPQ